MITIEIEGITCAGKTTTIPVLTNLLEEKGLTVVSAKEPGETLLGRLARNYVLEVSPSKRHALSDMLLFLAARSNVYEEVISSNTSDVALFDRHYGSTFVYQCCLGGVPCSLLETLSSQMGYKVDMSFILDLEPKVAYERHIKREEIEPRADGGNYCSKSEFLEYNEKARMGFCRYYTDKRRSDNAFIINSTEAVETIAENIAAKIAPQTD